MQLSNPNLPTLITSCVLSFAVGALAGVLGMMAFSNSANTPSGSAAETADNAAPGPGAPGPAGGGRGGGRGGGGGRSGVPGPKAQLVSLVARIELLTGKAPTLELSAEQKRKIKDQLKGLDDLDRLTDQDARDRVFAITNVLGAHREELEAVGFLWPGVGPEGPPPPVGGPPPPPNPFREGANKQHLKALEERLENSKTH